MTNHCYSFLFLGFGGGGGEGEGGVQTPDTKILDYIGVMKRLLTMDKKHIEFLNDKI